MGLFSSKTITTVGTVVSRVVEDAALPGSIKTGVIKAIFNGGDISDYIMEELVGGIGVKADRMYEYAKRSYTHGLPSGQYYSATSGNEEAAAVLEVLEGSPVEIDYCHFGPPNNMHIGWMKLIELHGYNPATNILGNLTTTMGIQVYLEDANVVVPQAMMALLEPGVMEQWGNPARSGYTPQRPSGAGALLSQSPVIPDPAAVQEYLQVTYSYAIGQDLGLANFPIPLTGYLDEADYFHVGYTVNGVYKYWMYQVGTGVHPTLEAVFNTPPESSGSFFPIAHFRHNKQSMGTDVNTEAFKTSKKMLKYLGMDFPSIAESIDANPDIDDVEQAMMVMAVPATTTNPLEQRYLYEFFNRLYLATGGQFRSPTHGAVASLLSSLDVTRNSMVIQDNLFKMALSNGGMYKRRRAGSIGAVGEYASSSSTITSTHELVDWDGKRYSQVNTSSIHIYRRQVSHAFYDEIQIVDLKMVYHVFGQYTTTGDEDDKILLIPLDRAITDDFGIPDRETLYARSLHYVFNSRVLTKLKWYQSGWFEFLMIAVALVVTVMTLGADGGTFMTLAAAIASGSSVAISAAVWALITQLLIGLAISFALKLFVKAVGVEFAFLAAIVAAAYGFNMAFDAGSIAGAPWASELLQLASGLADAVSMSMKEAMQGLVTEFQDLQLLKDAAAIDLEKANDLLENNNWLSPIVIFGESPNDFYNRTTHSGNVGLMAIGAISNYVDIALKLPELNETIES